MEAEPYPARDSLRIVVPPGLETDDEICYLIGHLVMEWGICESLFLGALRCIINSGDGDHAVLVWLSYTSSRARGDLLKRAAASAPIQRDLREELDRQISRFNGITRARNFYCHANYTADPATMKLAQIEGAQLTSDERIYDVTIKQVGKATVNELRDAIRRCRVINLEMWPVLFHLRRELRAQHVELPALPASYPHNPRFPLPDRG